MNITINEKDFSVIIEISSDLQHQKAIGQLLKLMDENPDPPPFSRSWQKIKKMTDLIEQYEEKEFPIPELKNFEKMWRHLD